MKRQTFTPGIKSIHEIQAFVLAHLSPGLKEQDRTGMVELMMEEIVINIINHGFKHQPAPLIQIGVDRVSSNMVIEIQDNGIPFDPLKQPDPDIKAPLDQREPGGLGIYLVKQLASDIRYSRAEGWNILRLTL